MFVLDQENRPYAFSYGVNDADHGTNFNREESSDGKGTKGQYKVGCGGDTERGMLSGYL